MPKFFEMSSFSLIQHNNVSLLEDLTDPIINILSFLLCK